MTGFTPAAVHNPSIAVIEYIFIYFFKYVLTYVLPGFVSVVIFQSACLESYKEYCYKNLND